MASPFSKMWPVLSALAEMSAQQLAELSARQKSEIGRELGLPVSALDRIIPSEQRSLHYRGRRPHTESAPKGVHPQMHALLKDCADSSLTSIDPSQLQTKHVGDQLRAICKHGIYEQFASAIEEIWTTLHPTLEKWRTETGSYVGTLEEASSDHRQTTMRLIPLADKQRTIISGSPSLEAVFVQLMHYSRDTWGAAIMQWSEQNSVNTRYDRYLPQYFTQSDVPVPFKQDLLRGVNTAIKIAYSINYLLLKLSGRIESEEKWKQLQEYNYSFAALWAAASVTTLAVLTEKLTFLPDQATLDYLTKMGVISSAHAQPGAPGFEILDPAYFCLREETPGKQAIDLDDGRVAGIRQLPIQADVMVKKCPALKIGVVKAMYDWINDIVTDTLKASGRAPWS